MNISFHFFPLRTGSIIKPAVIVIIGAVNNGCTSHEINIMAAGKIIPVNVGACYIIGSAKHPPVEGYSIITGISGSNYNTGTQRSPAIVSGAASPANPGGSPVYIRYPEPAITIVIHPSSIMKRSPAPGEVRYPCPAIIGIYPMTGGGIRNKVGTRIGNPHIPIRTIINPLTIRG
jgi:hypothetical protein